LVDSGWSSKAVDATRTAITGIDAGQGRNSIDQIISCLAAHGLFGVAIPELSSETTVDLPRSFEHLSHWARAMDGRAVNGSLSQREVYDHRHES
jgi:hypothetical protein